MCVVRCQINPENTHQLYIEDESFLDKTHCFLFTHDKDSDQPEHYCSLISTFIDPCMDSIIPVVSISKSLKPHLISVAGYISLCRAVLKTPQNMVYHGRSEL